MNTDIDWVKERKRFPACSKYTYLMNAANSPLSDEVYRAEKEVLDILYHDAHTSWEKTIEIMNSTRAMLAKLAGGSPHDWGFGASTGHNMGFLAISIKNKEGLGDIISCSAEYPSGVTPWVYQGFNVIKVLAKDNGIIDLQEILDSITPQTKAVVLSHIQFSSGVRSNIKWLGKELYKKEIPFIVNATQSLGAFPLNTEECYISALTCSVHKWLGAAYGLSLLYTTKNWRQYYPWAMASTMSYDDPTFSGAMDNPRSDTGFMELGALPFNQIIGVHASLKDALRLGIDNISKRILFLTQYLEDRLKKKHIPQAFDRHGDNRSGITFLKVKNPTELEAKLLSQNILVNERRGNIRVSLHYFNNTEDIDRLISML